MLLCNTIPEYNYGLKIKGIQFGTFLKDEKLPCPKKLKESDFLNSFKAKYNLKNVFWLEQVHSSDVVLVDIDSVNELKKGDACITNIPKIALCSFHADCQVVFFFDPINYCIAIAHAGFKGQILKIYTNVINQMVKAYGCLPKDIIAIFSPSLSQKNAEFKNYKTEFPQELWKYKTDTDKFDLKKIAEVELLANGLDKKNIYLNSSCTYEYPELFYSYRRDKTDKRLISFIFLEN